MKLTVEIRDSLFCYSYEVGKNMAAGEIPISADSLVLFTDVLRACSLHQGHCQQERIDEIIAKSYIKDHPELLKGGEA